MILLCKPHIVKFIIFLTSLIQILVYYLLELLLITFITTSFVSIFVVKFVIVLAFLQKIKSILQNKNNRVLL